MTNGRVKEILRMAKRATPARLHDLYVEVYGADFAGKVDAARARVSIVEACRELLARKGDPASETPVEPEPPETCAVKSHESGVQESVEESDRPVLASQAAGRRGPVAKRRTLEPL